MMTRGRVADAALVIVHTYHKVPSDAVVGMIGSGQLGDWHHMMAHQGVEYPAKSGHWYIPAWFRTGFNAETIEFQLIVLSPSGDILEFDPRGRRMLPPPQYDTAYKVTWGYRETAEVLPDSLIQKLDLYNVAWNGWVTDILKRVENKRFAKEEDECLWSTLIAQFATKDIGSDYDADISTDDDDSEYDTNDDSGSIGHGSNTSTEFPETGEWDQLSDGEVSTSLSCCDFIGESEILRSVPNFSDCDSHNNLPQSDEILHNDLIEKCGNESDSGYQQKYCSESLTETEADQSFDTVSVGSSAFEITIIYDADFAVPFELPVTAEDALEDIEVSKTGNAQIAKENVEMNHNNNESVEEDERSYVNNDTASLDSKSAFAPSCNFNENGVEDSVLDACLDYKSNESAVEEEKKYENYDTASLDSKSAFAPSCNFIFNENGVEDSVLDACLDYKSNESAVEEEKKYENYDTASLDSKSAFAPSCNFIFDENGVEDSVLDACLDYKSNESAVEEEKKYENYDTASLESNCAFAPSYDFLLDENGVEDSVLDNCLDVIKEDKSEEVTIEDADQSVDSDNKDNGDDDVDEEERVRKLRAEIREMNGETDDDWKYLTDEDDDEEEIAAKVAAMDFGDDDCYWFGDSDGEEGGFEYFTKIAKIKRRRNKPWNRVKDFFTEKLDDLKFGCDVVKYHVKRTATVFFYKHLHWRLYRYGRYHWV